MRWAFPGRAPVRHAQIPATWSSIHFKHLKHQSLTRACNRGCEPTNQRTNEEHVSNSSNRCSLASSAQYRSRNARRHLTTYLTQASFSSINLSLAHGTLAASEEGKREFRTRTYVSA
jgi:hypothetical protein